MRLTVLLLLALFMSGCTVNITSFTEVNHRPSRVERQLDTKWAPLMCPTVWMALDILYNGEIHPSCRYYSVLAPRVRGYVYHYRWYTLMEIGPPGNERYWYEPGRIRP